MAGFDWRMMQFSDQTKQQIPTHKRSASQIACRICNQIFNSTQTLITHIESHMSQETNPNNHPTSLSLNLPSITTAKSQSANAAATTTAAIRGHCQPNPLQFSFYFPTKVPEINDGNGHEHIGASQAWPAIAAAKPVVEKPEARRQCFPVKTLAVKGSGDRTMPLLHQLEKRKTGNVPYHRRSFSDSVDLTLKL